MAEASGDSYRSLTVFHETEGDDYRMTVHDSKSGTMQFSMSMPIDEAIELVYGMARTLGVLIDE